jgi:hypothetical protein
MPLKNNSRFCGARCKRDKNRLCRQPCIKNRSKCRMHGGMSTGPKTIEGKKRSSIAPLKHGMFTKFAIAEKLKVREMLKWAKDL